MRERRSKEALAAADRSRILVYRKAADDAARAFFEGQNPDGPWPGG